jgi:hypothetical protein
MQLLHKRLKINHLNISVVLVILMIFIKITSEGQNRNYHNEETTMTTTTHNPTPVTGYSEGIIESTEKPTRCVETFSDDRPDNINFYFKIDDKFYNVNPRREDLGGFPVRFFSTLAPVGWPEDDSPDEPFFDDPNYAEPNKPTTFEQFVASRKIEENLIDVTDAVDYDAIGLSYLDGKYFIEKQYDADAIHPEIHNVSYVVYIGNQIEDFGSNLDAAEKFLWNEWARGEENWKHVRFDTEFGPEYVLAQSRVLDLIDYGFEDDSWHNNICPSFIHVLRQYPETVDFGSGPREITTVEYVEFWYDAPNPEDRECGPDSPQFAVHLRKDSELIEVLYEGNDFYLALTHALGQVAKPIDEDEWGSDRQIDAQNKFGCFIVDDILPQHLAQKFEDYGLKATTEELVSYGIELVAKRHPSNYDVACGDCGQKYNATHKPHKCGACGSTFIAVRYNEGE